MRLATLDENLFCHYLLGLELRALFYACCNEFAGNAEIWLIKYEEHEWSVKQRGPFPFDVTAWVTERAVLEHRFVMQTHLIYIAVVTNVRFKFVLPLDNCCWLSETVSSGSRIDILLTGQAAASMAVFDCGISCVESVVALELHIW